MILNGDSMNKAFVMLIIVFPLFLVIYRFTISDVTAYTLLGIGVLALVWIDYRLDKIFPKRD
jgi:hypothetical protein